MNSNKSELISRRAALIGGGVALAGGGALAGALGVVSVLPPLQAANPEWLYVPTPPNVVARMLELAKVTKDDVVVDLGSGDGRIPIAAAREFGARSRGVDIDPVRISESNENLKRSGVSHLVNFVQGDVFKEPVADATVVTIFLFPHVVLRLRDRLRSELKPGTRIVSHQFKFANWDPLKSEDIGSSSIFLWVV
jgi:SAM-dependent methyltransferase